jgi:hypothetical protein
MLKTNIRAVARLALLSIFCFAYSLTQASAQDRIDPLSPIDAVTYSLEDSGKTLMVTVALRKLPTTAPADVGIPLTSFKMGPMGSPSSDKTVRLSTSASTSLKAVYRIEISDNPSEQDIRLKKNWTELSFYLTATYKKPGDDKETFYQSPNFTIVRNIQLPTIAIGTPKWQAENSGNTITKYLAVPITPSEAMKVNIEIRDSNGVVAEKNNFLVGGNQQNIELDPLPNSPIVAKRKYTIKVTSISETSSVTNTSDWTPDNFIDNYRLTTNTEDMLASLPSVESDKVKVSVTTRVPGKSLRLITEGLSADKVKTVQQNDQTWDFEVDLTGVGQKTIPFYFDGEGSNGQVFTGSKRYFFTINNDLRVVGPLTVSFTPTNDMVVNYKLNRKANDHRLRLEVPGILELTDLPKPVGVGDTTEYNVTAKTQVTALLTGLAQNLKGDDKKSFPVKFKLIASDAASNKPFSEFAIYAYGVTTGDYLKKIAGISELVSNSKKFDTVDVARKAVLDILGLQSLPSDTAESKTVESIVNLLTTVKNNDDRRKSFWKQLAGYAFKIIPPLVGIPVSLPVNP